MCYFLSLIVKKDGEIIYDPNTMSHEDLIEKAGLKDDTADKEKMEFARVEVLPPNGDYFETDLLKWFVKVDESITPTWLETKHEKACLDLLEKVYKDHIHINENIKEINSGVHFIKDCKVESIYGSAKVRYIYDSAKVGYIYGSAEVGSISGSAKVGSIYGSAKVGSIYGSAKVESIYDSAKVGYIYGSAKVGSIYDSAVILSITNISNIKKYSGKVILIDRGKNIIYSAFNFEIKIKENL